MTLRYIIPLCALALAMPGVSAAQDLHKEITVEQEIVPARRDASRIMVHPAISLPPLQASSLTFSDRTVTTEVPNTITILDPVAWGDRLYASPYRGYVDLGAGGPLFNGNLSAGYRILDDDRTRLSIWGQYDGSIYNHGRDPLDRRLRFNNHTATAGLDLHRAVGERSMINAGVDYTYATHTLLQGYKWAFRNPASRINANVDFSSATAGVAYYIGLKYRRFAFGDRKGAEFLSINGGPAGINSYTNVSENLFGALLKGSLATSETSHAGIDADLSFLRTSDFRVYPIPLYDNEFFDFYGKTTGLITVTPYWTTHNDKVTLRVGADLDLAVKSGNALRVSPDVKLAWTPTQIFGIELKAHGGSQLNSVSALYDITPYLSPAAAYPKLSRIPYAFDGKITLGPFLGSFIELFGGYAKADRWLMGATGIEFPGGAIMHAVDLKGWHAGVAAGYDNGKNFSLKASWETAPSDYNKGYFEWRDRARHVVKADLRIRPIAKLRVEVNYELRSGRCEYGFDRYGTVIMGLPYYEPERHRLGNLSNLSAGAAYEFTDRLTFFLRGENLMNREWYALGDIPVQGIHGLIGLGFKF